MATSFSIKRNNAYSTLLYSHAVNDGQLTIQAADATLFPATFPFRVTVYQSAGIGNLGQRYGTIFDVTGASSNVFMVSVASDESPASTDQAFTVATGQVFSVELDWTYGSAHEYETAINAAENNIATNTSSISNISTEITALQAEFPVAGSNIGTSAILLSDTVSVAGDQTLTGSFQTFTGMSSTVTIPAGGRSVEIEVIFDAQTSVAGDYVTITFIKDTVNLGRQRNAILYQTGISTSFHFFLTDIAPSAGSHTYSFGGIFNGTGTTIVNGGSPEMLIKLL
jgi:hypothetical protein